MPMGIRGGGWIGLAGAGGLPDFSPQILAQQFCHIVFVRIAHHPLHPGQLGDFLRCALGVAAGHEDPAFRVSPVDAAHNLANFRVGTGGDGAGVEDGHGAPVNSIDLVKPGVQQLFLECRTVGLARPAAEIEQVECAHREEIFVFDSR